MIILEEPKVACTTDSRIEKPHALINIETANGFPKIHTLPQVCKESPSRKVDGLMEEMGAETLTLMSVKSRAERKDLGQMLMAEKSPLCPFFLGLMNLHVQF
jgi:hypothetical protein